MKCICLSSQIKQHCIPLCKPKSEWLCRNWLWVCWPWGSPPSSLYTSFVSTLQWEVLFTFLHAIHAALLLASAISVNNTDYWLCNICRLRTRHTWLVLARVAESGYSHWRRSTRVWTRALYDKTLSVCLQKSQTCLFFIELRIVVFVCDRTKAVTWAIKPEEVTFFLDCDICVGL